jgi:hypothetical protein
MQPPALVFLRAYAAGLPTDARGVGCMGITCLPAPDLNRSIYSSDRGNHLITQPDLYAESADLHAHASLGGVNSSGRPAWVALTPTPRSAVPGSGFGR